MSIEQAGLEELVAGLVGRPGHEQVRVNLHRILTAVLGAPARYLELEAPLKSIRGRADALLGRTVVEIKSNLRRERTDARTQLGKYLDAQQKKTAMHWVGLATDGADWEAYLLREGELRQVGAYQLTTAEQAGDWLAWLDGMLLLESEKAPTPRNIDLTLGRNSPAYAMAAAELHQLWDERKTIPGVKLKLNLWKQMLRIAYWQEVDDDDLFQQHTYLTIMAKGIAILAIIDEPQRDVEKMLSGTAFGEVGILGGVEHDLFSWVVRDEHDQAGKHLVRSLLNQLRSFNFQDVQTDVLKTLYESLIDPAERHDLGEYYTPDWLAEQICREAINKPLAQRVLDPSCGSGTFLFHAIRRVLAAAEEAGRSEDEALELACNHVAGVDINPVAVVLASTTVILALQHHLRHRKRRNRVYIPVYLGDSVQWNVELTLGRRKVTLQVPGKEEAIHFPVEVAQDPGMFDPLLENIQDHLNRNESAATFAGWLQHQGAVPKVTHKGLQNTYSTFLGLKRQGRDDIWPYVAKHLARPVWLSRPAPRMDVLVGNPPWVAYRFMSSTLQKLFRKECERLEIWVGGRFAPQQDLAAYFFARCAELYLKPRGKLALVMPLSALTREIYAPLLRGRFTEAGFNLRFTGAWSLDYQVQPLFAVPTCVLFADKVPASQPSYPHPATLRAFSGQLPRRDAKPEEAQQALTTSATPWPTQTPSEISSYAKLFRNGAILVPRRFVLVDEVPAGRFGRVWDTPKVRGRTGRKDKAPWNEVAPVENLIERTFLRPVLLGASIAPFRILKPELGVIPWDADHEVLMDSTAAREHYHKHLATWLEQAEQKWDAHKSSDLSFKQQLDYYKKLTAQFPIRPLRVVYTASGKFAAAVLIREEGLNPAERSVIDNTLYWMEPASLAEAHYLIALLNSEALRVRIAKYQSPGPWGGRHFDKSIFKAPIPRFDDKQPLHRALAEAATQAERVAEAVPLDQGAYFQQSRRRLRNALIQDGIAENIDHLVNQLL